MYGSNSVNSNNIKATQKQMNVLKTIGERETVRPTDDPRVDQAD